MDLRLFFNIYLTRISSYQWHIDYISCLILHNLHLSSHAGSLEMWVVTTRRPGHCCMEQLLMVANCQRAMKITLKCSPHLDTRHKEQSFQAWLGCHLQVLRSFPYRHRPLQDKQCWNLVIMHIYIERQNIGISNAIYI